MAKVIVSVCKLPVNKPFTISKLLYTDLRLFHLKRHCETVLGVHFLALHFELIRAVNIWNTCKFRCIDTSMSDKHFVFRIKSRNIDTSSSQNFPMMPKTKTNNKNNCLLAP